MPVCIIHNRCRCPDATVEIYISVRGSVNAARLGSQRACSARMIDAKIVLYSYHLTALDSLEFVVTLQRRCSAARQTLLVVACACAMVYPSHQRPPRVFVNLCK